MLNTNTVVIGAGPAGLAAAHKLMQQQQNFLILDAGQPLAHRNREAPTDIGQGIGGAGLFSDGKFSFFPSASRLWDTLKFTHLSTAYDWLAELLSRFGMTPPTLPSDYQSPPSIDHGLKVYPSYYLDLANRYQLISTLSQPFQDKILFNAQVTDIAQIIGGYRVHYGNRAIDCKQLIIATGRLGPLLLARTTLKFAMQFQRYELGFRIQGPYDHPFFKHLQACTKYPDPKFIIPSADPNISWRTFCFCKRGQIVNSGSQQTIALSGRSDGRPTNLSNIGFNTRIKDPNLLSSLPQCNQVFKLSLQDFLTDSRIVAQCYGPPVASLMQQGIAKLRTVVSAVATVAHQLEIVGPTIEGIGKYPIVDGDLKTPGHPIYVCGDGVGLFRGITAAMLSGHYAAQQVLAA